MRIDDEKQIMNMEERDWNYIMPAYLRSYLFYTKNVPPAEIVFPMFKAVKYGEITIPVKWVEPESVEAMEVAADAGNIPEATEAEIAQKDAEERPPIAEQVKEITKEVLTPAPEDLLRQTQEAKPEEVSAARAAFSAVEEAATEEPTTGEVVNAEEPTTQPPPSTPTPPISEATQPAPQPPQPTAQPSEPGTNAKPPAPDRPPKLPPVVIPPGQPLDGMHPRDKADQSQVAKDLAVQKEVDEGKEIEQDVDGLKK